MKGSQTKSDRNVVFVTNDEALQIKAEILELPVESYKNAQVADVEKLYGEIEELILSEQELACFYEGGDLNIPSLEALSLNTPVRLLYSPKDSNNETEILCL